MVRKRTGRHSLSSAAAGLGVAILGVLAPTAIEAASAPGEFPSSDLFRELQLTTLACGRENSSASCEQARNQADRLLDHPRLPALCKDTLWTIRQRAKVANLNTLERRDPIDRAARDLPLLCRQKIRPASKPEETRPTGSGSGASGGGQPGFNFGGPSSR